MTAGIRLDETTLRELHSGQLTINDIAYAMGVSRGAVARRMRELKLKAWGKIGGDRKSATFKAHRETGKGYSAGSLAAEAMPIGKHDAEEAQWRERNPWPDDMHFEDADVPRERFLGRIGTNADVVSMGCATAMASDAFGSTGHWISPKARAR